MKPLGDSFFQDIFASVLPTMVPGTVPTSSLGTGSGVWVRLGLGRCVLAPFSEPLLRLSLGAPLLTLRTWLGASPHLCRFIHPAGSPLPASPPHPLPGHCSQGPFVPALGLESLCFCQLHSPSLPVSGLCPATCPRGKQERKEQRQGNSPLFQ